MCKRVNVTFTEGAYEALQSIADESGKTVSDVIRDSLALSKWVHDERRAGSRLLIEHKGDRELRELVWTR